jgi:hypothetical protein
MGQHSPFMLLVQLLEEFERLALGKVLSLTSIRIAVVVVMIRRAVHGAPNDEVSPVPDDMIESVECLLNRDCSSVD